MKKIKELINIPVILIVLLMVVGIGLFGYGVNRKIEIDRRIEGYESTTGYYVDKEIYSEAKHIGKQHKQATYALIYAYTVNGIEYAAKTDYGTEAIPYYGSEKIIYYNPVNPSEAMIGGTNSSDGLILGGMFFILIPGVFLLVWLVANGVFDKLTFNIMDVVIGVVFFVLGVGMIYVIAGGFSVSELFMLAGPMALIPIMFLFVGVFMVWRGFFGGGKHVK